MVSENQRYHPDIMSAYGLESADGYATLYTQRYQEFFRETIAPLLASDNCLEYYLTNFGNRAYMFLPRSVSKCECNNAFKSPALVDISFDKYWRLDLMSLANVRYILSPVPLDSEHLRLIPSEIRDRQFEQNLQGKREKITALLTGNSLGIPYFIYENDQVLPRAFLAKRVRPYPDSSGVILALRKAMYDDLKTTAFISVEDLPAASSLPISLDKGNVTWEEYSTDSISLRVTVSSTTVLIVTNAYSSFWHASIDGTGALLFPADLAFQGILIPPGEHMVQLRYEPPYAFRNLEP